MAVPESNIGRWKEVGVDDINFRKTKRRTVVSRRVLSQDTVLCGRPPVSNERRESGDVKVSSVIVPEADAIVVDLDV